MFTSYPGAFILSQVCDINFCLILKKFQFNPIAIVGLRGFFYYRGIFFLIFQITLLKSFRYKNRTEEPDPGSVKMLFHGFSVL